MWIYVGKPIVSISHTDILCWQPDSSCDAALLSILYDTDSGGTWWSLVSWPLAVVRDLKSWCDSVMAMFFLLTFYSQVVCTKNWLSDFTDLENKIKPFLIFVPKKYWVPFLLFASNVHDFYTPFIYFSPSLLFSLYKWKQSTPRVKPSCNPKISIKM